MSKSIESLLEETRTFSPLSEFSQNARISDQKEYEALYQHSIDQPEQFWASQAQELAWFQPWDTVLEWDAPDARWFGGAKMNLCFNAVDRHVLTGKGDKVAILWEGENGESESITYSELLKKVSRFSHVLENQGVKPGDRVLVYMPMVPEATIAMLACARIGAVHSVVFGGFSAEAIADRLQDSAAKVVVTADGGYRRGKVVPLKANVDRALHSDNVVKSVIVFQRTRSEVTMTPGRDFWWSELSEPCAEEHNAVPLDSEHPLFILYTSGSTGKPKGILHTNGGYMVGSYVTCKYIFDMQEDDVYWCTADVGWITGHTYICYGPMLNGVTQVIYEGAPNYPDFGRFWSIVEKYKVSIFYTAPTAVRAFIKAGDHFPNQYDLSSLRLLGTVGEPINPEAWMWYHKVIGAERCPIVDTWWQTETGAIMIAPIPGFTKTTPGTATKPFLGIDAAILDENGNECAPNEGGKLVVRKPWPSMLRGVYGDPERYRETYWSDYDGVYTTGDGAVKDEKGNFWIIGRLDDVLNVSGHRLGTAEIESALVAHDLVAEAAIVGKPDELKGESVIGFVTLKSTQPVDAQECELELKKQVSEVIGAIARPERIFLVSALPKTRSGKIMRRLLKEVLEHGQIEGNTTTLEDESILSEIVETVTLNR